MKKTNLLLAAIVIIGLPLAFLSFDNPAPKKADFGEMYLPIWMNAKSMSVAVAQAMPEDKYSYKPTDVSKTFGTQMVHIGYSASWVADMYLDGEKKAWEEPSAEGMTKAQIIELIEKNFDAVAEKIKATEDWDAETTSFTGNKMSKAQAMNAIQDHITNHRAKANLYVRMNEVEPPKYGYY